MLELTISFEAQVEDARQRKQAKYQDLVEAACAAGFSTELITVEIGSRGMVDDSTFAMLQSAVKASQKDLSSLCMTIIRTTILESYKIWCSRNLCT